MALVSGLPPPLSCRAPGHQRNPHAGVLSCFERFAASPGPCHPLDGSLLLCPHILPILPLAAGDGRAVLLVRAFARGGLGVPTLTRARLREPVPADRWRAQRQRRRWGPVLWEEPGKGLAVCSHRTIQRPPRALHWHGGLGPAPTHPHRTRAALQGFLALRAVCAPPGGSARAPRGPPVPAGVLRRGACARGRRHTSGHPSA